MGAVLIQRLPPATLRDVIFTGKQYTGPEALAAVRFSLPFLCSAPPLSPSPSEERATNEKVQMGILGYCR